MDPFIAEIRIFAGNYAPRGWALCNGQVLPINQNTALYALLGVTFGGDGRSTFGLPNLQGRAAVDAGAGQGLTQHPAGEMGGQPTVTLNGTNLPSHNHTMNAAGRPAGSTSPTPAGGTALAPTGDNNFYDDSGGGAVAMSGSAIGATGGNGPHNNLQPFLALTYIIALQGVFPQRP